MSESGTTKKVGLVGKIIATPFVLLVVLMLLAVPGVAIFMAYQTVATIATWQKAKGWVETSATITHLNLEADSGDDGTTYRVVCNYIYVFNGTTYQSDRVGLTGGSDNIDSWQQDTYNRLKQHQDALESDPVTCWVNPDNPAEAVLDRSLRTGMLLFYMAFVVLFGGASLVVVGVGRAAQRRKKQRQALQLEHPDRPWVWKAAWADGRIRPQQRVWVFWAFAIFWNVISFPVVLSLVPDAVRTGQYWTLLFAIFPVIGLVMLAAATVVTLRQYRFGRSHFDLDTRPGIIGGHLVGDLVIVGDVTSLEDVSVALRCINRVTRRKGDGEETTERTMWEDTQTLRVAPAIYGQTEMRLTVDFQIPYDCLPCDDSNPKDQILWQLTAKGDIPGANLDLKFDVPVFRTPESRPAIGESPEKITRIEAALDNPESPLPRKIRRERDLDGGPVFVVSAWPGWGTFFLTTLLSAGLLTGGGVWLRTVWPDGGWSIVLPATLCLGGLLILWAEIRGFFGSTRTTLRRGEVLVERVRLLVNRRIGIPRADVREVKSSKSAQVRSGSEMTQYYVVHLVTTDGRKVKLGGMIPGEQLTRWLVRQIEDELTR